MLNQKVQFNFKASTERDAAGNIIKDEKGEPKKIPAGAPLVIEIPQFESVADVQDILAKNDEKEVALLLEVLNDLMKSNAKQLIDDDRDAAREKGLDAEKLTFNFIANIPPATRRGAAIPDEVWEGFEKDYVAVMMAHGKQKANAEMGAKLLTKKFGPVRTNKKVIEGLRRNLDIWFGATENADEFAGIYQNLSSKADTLLAADEDAILAAI